MKAQTKYNYIRISGNNFGPFLEVLYQIVHEQEPDEKKRKNLVVITETACLEDMEDVDTTQQVEQINLDNLKLIIGYVQGTHLPAYAAITDSLVGITWYVSDYSNQTITKRDCNDPIFQEGGYRIFKCIANRETVSNVFSIIVSQAEGNETYKQWDIIDIFGSYNIDFDDMLGNSNNTQHRSDWIMTEQYFMSAVPEGDDN